MATPAQMPMRNERSAPTFDPSKPRELVRYFEDLEDHFSRCTINNLGERKRWTLRYVSIEVADLWESLDEWATAATWEEIKTAVQARYPASRTERRHTHQELLTLVREHARKELESVTEWSEYLNQYITISKYLITQSRLSELEQRRHLLESLTTKFHREVSAHMRNVDPERDPEAIGTVAEIDEAVCYCLRSPFRVKFEDPLPSSSSSFPIKQEPSESIADLVSQLVQKELVQRARSWGPPPMRSDGVE